MLEMYSLNLSYENKFNILYKHKPTNKTTQKSDIIMINTWVDKTTAVCLDPTCIIQMVAWLNKSSSTIFILIDPAPSSWIKVVGMLLNHPLTTHPPHPELSQAGSLKQFILLLLRKAYKNSES